MHRVTLSLYHSFSWAGLGHNIIMIESASDDISGHPEKVRTSFQLFLLFCIRRVPRNPKSGIQSRLDRRRQESAILQWHWLGRRPICCSVQLTPKPSLVHQCQWPSSPTFSSKKVKQSTFYDSAVMICGESLMNLQLLFFVSLGN